MIETRLQGQLEMVFPKKFLLSAVSEIRVTFPIMATSEVAPNKPFLECDYI